MATRNQMWKIGFAIVAGAAAITMISLHRTEQHGDLVSVAAPMPVSGAEKSVSKTLNIDNKTTRTAPADASLKAIRYKKALAESSNYWAYAHTILAAAKSGDADAQFYLSKVMERCDADSKFFLQHRGVTLTLEQVLQYAAQRNLPLELAQSAFDRCHEINERGSEELGDAADWLAQATAAGQPIAQATTASKLLQQNIQQDFARATGVPNPNTATPIANQTTPAALLREAVESGDPDVLFSIGEAQALLKSSNNDESIERYAWWLVACERGLDCSANADWVKANCNVNPQCASYSGTGDFVRDLAGDKWPNVQQRAQEISEKLEAGLWNELGIGSS